MKYIINENQKKIIGDVIMNFLDDNLTPDIPWDIAEEERMMENPSLPGEDETFIGIYAYGMRDPGSFLAVPLTSNLYPEFVVVPIKKLLSK